MTKSNSWRKICSCGFATKVADQLNKAILPLFSLSQFVYEIESFNALADRVASRPYRDDVITDGVNTHRNDGS